MFQGIGRDGRVACKQPSGAALTGLKLKSDNGGLVTPGRGLPAVGCAMRLGHFNARRFAMAGALFRPKIIPADKAIVIMVPGAGMIQRADAGGGYRKYRTLHIALFRIEILWQPGTRVVHEV